MIISKFKNKNGETCISIIIDKSLIHQCKGGNHYRVTLNPKFAVGLDAKHQAPISKVLRMNLLQFNNKEKE